MRQRRRDTHLLHGVVLGGHGEHAADQERGVRKAEDPEGDHDREFAFPERDAVWRAAEGRAAEGRAGSADQRAPPTGDRDIMKSELTSGA